MLLRSCRWLGDLLRTFERGGVLLVRLGCLDRGRALVALRRFESGGAAALPADAVRCACRHYWLSSVRNMVEVDLAHDYVEVLIQLVYGSG